VVCYKGSYLSYQIGRRLVNVKYISLVNLIMDKEVVKELIQNDLTVNNLKRELTALLTDKTKKKQLQKDYAALRQLLGEGGHASEKAAASITGFLRSAT
jgi:lipid-A-disaccharide synthase